MENLTTRPYDSSLLEKYGFMRGVKEAWWKAVYVAPDLAPVEGQMDKMVAKIDLVNILRIVDEFRQEDWLKAMQVAVNYFCDLLGVERLSVRRNDELTTDCSYTYVWNDEYEALDRYISIRHPESLRATRCPFDTFAAAGHEAWHVWQGVQGFTWLRKHAGRFSAWLPPKLLGRAALYGMNDMIYIGIDDYGEERYRQQLLEAEALRFMEKIRDRIEKCLSDESQMPELGTKERLKYAKFGWHVMNSI